VASVHSIDVSAIRHSRRISESWQPEVNQVLLFYFCSSTQILLFGAIGFRSAIWLKGHIMPMTDYTDPEIPFPRLEARVQKREPDAFWITIWLWKQAGGERQRILNRKQAGSFADAKEIIRQCAEELGADVGPDDIFVET
jgi:hypothetical protein